CLSKHLCTGLIKREIAYGFSSQGRFKNGCVRVFFFFKAEEAIEVNAKSGGMENGYREKKKKKGKFKNIDS
ncbi:hypothetical protein, partial [Clostridioides difficile]|uniref:hypothetical protein n=1 Tax=Clostridioides difficile TaxID=1496 RepID=UPI001A9A30DD